MAMTKYSITIIILFFAILTFLILKKGEKMTYQEGTFIRREGSRGVYLVKRKGAPIPEHPGNLYDVKYLEKCLIPDLETYLYYAKKMGTTYKDVDPSLFDSIQRGENIPSIKEPTPPSPPPSPRPNPYSWIKGLFTLTSFPPPALVKSLGFNLACLEKGAWNSSYAKGVANLSIKVIKGGGVISNEKEYGIIGYFIADEPENTGISASEVLRRYYDMKKKTSKPVGCIHMIWTVMQRDDPKYKPYFEEMQKLDFVLIDVYPYGRGHDPEDWLNKSYEALKSVSPPVIIIAQAFGIPNLYNVISDEQITKQDKFWRSKGYGIIWYVWRGSNRYSADIKRNYQEVMAKLHGMPWPPVPSEAVTTRQITCGKCKSILKVSVSSYPKKNKSLTCPICETSIIKGIKVEVISTPLIDSLRKAIAELDAKIAELERAIKKIREEIDRIKKEM